MKIDNNGEYMMNKKEVVEFSTWFEHNPRERYKSFNLVVQAYINHNTNISPINERTLVEAR